MRFGHTAGQNDIAVSTARDDQCIVWAPLEGIVLHTFLLPSTPLCLALDPADRAAYVGFEDGNIQLINFYKEPSLANALHSTDALVPSTQVDPADRWASPDATSPILCLDVSYDGTLILTGHHDGAINIWTVAGGRLTRSIASFDAPVTNLHLLPPTGFPNEPKPLTKLHTVTKPRYETTSDSSDIPQNWSLNLQITSNNSAPLPDENLRPSLFTEALTHPSLPDSMIEAMLTSLAYETETENAEANADLKAQNEALAKTLEEERQMVRELKGKIGRRKKDDEFKEARKRKRRERIRMVEERQRRVKMGESVGDVVMAEVNGDEEGLSSDTDELTD